MFEACGGHSLLPHLGHFTAHPASGKPLLSDISVHLMRVRGNGMGSAGKHPVLASPQACGAHTQLLGSHASEACPAGKCKHTCWWQAALNV